MLEETVRRSIKDYLDQLKGQGLEAQFGVVFGSYARGTAGKWSDVDLLIVSKRFDQEYGYDEVEQLWQAAAKTDSRIEPIPCGLREWEGESDNPVIEMAKRVGERIAA